MIRTILSLSVMAFMVAMVATGTVAFFSDTESSTNNVFAAGAVDLMIDNESYYNGAVSDGTSWELANLNDGNGPGPNGEYFFFNFLDVKPDDEGEDTISIHVDDNDAWACMDITITETTENGCTEPEAEDGDPTCGDPGVGEGELQNEINFIWWADDGDNVLENDETEAGLFYQDTLANMSQSIILADSTGQGILSDSPLIGDQTYYVAKAWCFGTLTLDALTQDGLGGGNDNGPLDRGTGIICDGSGLDNQTQTDSVVADISFEAVQSRHNDSFVCNDGGIGCTEDADVMFVLDSSGSIDIGELATLQTAASNFAIALDPSTPGVHIGVVDFDGDATLNQNLTDVLADIQSAISALVSGGSTNLAAGITTASTELADPGSDRPDGGSPDFMVIITDGQPDSEVAATAAANAAKAAGTTIYVVGIGDDVNDTYLESIATSAAHYFTAAEFADLETVLEGIGDCDGQLTT